MIVYILWYVTQSWEVMPPWDLPWLPKCRFKQLLIRKGRKWRNQDQSRNNSSVQFSCSVCPTLFNPMDCSMPAFSVYYQLPELAQSYVHWVHDAIQPSHPCPLLRLPSIFPSIRVFSSESVLHIRWPKYWSFSFNISPSMEHPGLISFRMDWLDLLAVQGTLQESSPTPQFKSINSLETSVQY